MAVLIREDSTMQRYEGPITIENAYEIIGTDTVEFVSMGEGLYILADENGKLKQRPFNLMASIICGLEDDEIVGPALFVRFKRNDDGEEVMV